MELQTKSPFGDDPHLVVALRCGFRGCGASSPCNLHEQIVVRLNVDGRELPEFKLSKPAFHELTQIHRDERELFHMLADFAVLADSPPIPQSIKELAAKF